MDKLYECAAAYQKLLDVNYRVVLGRKGKLIELRICFEPLHFHHLIGLHKLADLRIARASREKVFDRILDGTITYDFISSSRYFHEIERRIEPFAHFETILDQNKLVFRYNSRQNVFSLIDADYLLSTPYDNSDAYVFIAETQKTGIYFCRSFFPKGERDYTAGQTVYTMLYKEKINLTTGEIEVQYDRLTPKGRNLDLDEQSYPAERGDDDKKPSVKASLEALRKGIKNRESDLLNGKSRSRDER